MQNIAFQFQKLESSQASQAQGLITNRAIAQKNTTVFALHEKALTAAKRYLSAESELTAILEAIDSCRGYRELNFASLFEYARLGLGLSESVAYNLIAVARKTREVPALQSKLESRDVSLSNARMIAPVLTPQNQDKWLHAASTLSKRELERAIAQENPRLAPVPEQARYVSSERMELKLGVSEELMTRLRRVQDLLSSQQGKAVSLEDVLEVLSAEFIRREDPLEKARRAQERRDAALKSGLIRADRSQDKVNLAPAGQGDERLTDLSPVDAKDARAGQTALKHAKVSHTKICQASTKQIDAKKTEVRQIETKIIEANKVDAKQIETKIIEANKVEVKQIEAMHAEAKQGSSLLRTAATTHFDVADTFIQIPVPGLAPNAGLQKSSPDPSNANAKKAPFQKRDPIPASVQYQVHLRDGHRCTAQRSDETRCEQRRWLEIHHIHWLSRGGKTEVNNLTTLCRAHHQ